MYVGFVGRAHLGLRSEALPGEGERLHLARRENRLLVSHGYSMIVDGVSWCCCGVCDHAVSAWCAEQKKCGRVMVERNGAAGEWTIL